MKSLSILAVFLFSLLSTCNPEAETVNRISVSGNKFVDAENKEFIFKGLNASDPDKLFKDGMWTQIYFDEMKSWGSNLVRFPIHPSAWRERGQASYLKLIDDGIAMAEKAGMYVLLDWHSIGNLKTEKYQHERYYTTKAETFEFWKLMAKRYGKNPTVAFFELFNEPTTIRGELGNLEWSEWKAMMEELISEIRKEDVETIPLVAGFDWAYDLTPVIAHPIDAASVAYVSHPYPMKRQKPWEAQWEIDFGHVSEKYPVILTEIGFCEEGEKGAHIPVIDDGSYVKAITDYANSKKMSYIIWVFDTMWSPHLIEDWEFTPSKSGKLWKEHLMKQ